MAQERLSMRKIKEILRLKLTSGLSNRQVARSLGVSRSSVDNYWKQAQLCGLSTWEKVAELSDEELEGKLSAEETEEHSTVTSNVTQSKDNSKRPMPDFQKLHEELRSNKYVTLTLLWEEYKEEHPLGLQLSWFSELYRIWKKKLDFVMRHDHKGGEKLFIDYCDGISITDPKTGKAIPTQLFVAVWGASNYTYAEASLTQNLFSWTKSHVRAFEYFGCVPHIAVPDNLKSAVNKACRYEPDINPTYQDLATHYQMAVVPARPRSPRDKAKVETGVLVSQRWILAALRHRRFMSLSELNIAISELLERLNSRKLKKMEKSRHELFLTLDKPNAKSLPEKTFEFALWKKARVNLDYHIEVDSHYYSVPYRFIHETVDVRISALTVEIFHKGNRIASHIRSHYTHRHTTVLEHMPSAHRAYAEMTPGRIRAWAAKTGPKTEKLLEALLATKACPEQGYRAALGVLRLGKRYGSMRLEKAAERAINYKNYTYRSVKNILARCLDTQQEEDQKQNTLPLHENIRGENYYGKENGGNIYVE